MGCNESTKKAADPGPDTTTIVAQQGQLIEPTGGRSGGQGGRGGGKPKKWQIMLENQWRDYEEQEDKILKRAYLIGQPNAEFSLRGQKYKYHFRTMTQHNQNTGKDRKIRPPPGPKPPKNPLLPRGPMVILTVREGQAGNNISVPDPNNPGKSVNVFVPPHARPGQKMAVPIPAKGESVSAVQEKQKKHDAEKKKSGGKWSTGGKVAATGAALVGVGAIGVGGVILGDHLAGGEMAGEIGSVAEGVGEDVADWATTAGEDVGEWFGDAGEWLGDAAEDVGDFIVDLF